MQLTGPDYLDEIEVAVRGRAMYDQLIVDCVLKARDHGYSWGAIGKALGTTRQAASERFVKHMEDR